MPVYSVKFDNPTYAKGGGAATSAASPTVVSIKNQWFAPWQASPLLFPRRLVWSVNTQLGRGEFLYRYGQSVNLTRPAALSVIAPADWIRWFVKVQFPGGVWIGQINAQPVQLLGSSSGIASGAMSIIADSLESIYFHDFVTESVYADYDKKGDAKLPPFKTAQKGITFNKGGIPNKASETFPNTKLYFSREQNAEFWSTQDIVQYAVQEWTPRNQSQTQAGVTVTLDDADKNKLPSWDRPIVPTHGYRPIEILNRLVSRRRLLMWWLELDESEPSNPQMKFRVATYTKDEVEDGDGNKIPGNEQQYILDADDDSSAEIVVEEDANSFVDQVVVQGAKRRTCCTVAFSAVHSSTLHIGEARWGKSLEEDYEFGAAGNNNYPADRGDQRAYNERYRSQLKFRDVFARFGLNRKKALPPDDPDGYEAAPFEVKLTRTLPLLENRDYKGNVIKNGIQLFDTDPNAKEMQPVVFLKLGRPEWLQPGGLGVYIDASKIGRKNDVPERGLPDKYDFSCTLTMAGDDSFYLDVIQTGEQHVLASVPVQAQNRFGEFQGLAADKNLGGVDWREMLATVSMEDDRFCEGVWPASPASGNAPLRRLLIDAGDSYRLDWVAPYTAVDTDIETGDVVLSTGGYFRDDRSKLESIARRAYAYYGTVRGILRMASDYAIYSAGPTPFRLGAFIQKIKNGSVFRSVNSPVTQVSMDFPLIEAEVPTTEIGRPRVSMITSFGEVDAAFFLGTPPQ